MTQKECSLYLQVSLRSYCRYESNEEKVNSIKYQFMVDKLKEFGIIDENHGIPTISQIQQSCDKVFKDYPVEYCYLFGSYAKGIAKETSNVDLLISTDLKGLQFYGLVESLGKQLHKKVDVLDFTQLNNNPLLTQEILKDGIKIYGQHQK